MNQFTNNTKRSKKIAIPSTNMSQPRNGRRRRRNRRGGGVPGGLLPGGIKIRDTEIFPMPDKEKLLVLQFCPGKSTLTRLDYEALKYRRWSLIRVSFSYQPTAALSDSGSVTYGILPGPADMKVVKEGDITKLKPFQKHSLWKSSSLTVSSNICIQPHYMTNATSEDSVAFTMYLWTTNNSLGVMRVTYDLFLNYPKP